MRTKPLVDEIKDFQKDKQKLIPLLIGLGVLGLILPVIPGTAFLLLGLLLLFPQQGQNILKRIRNTFRL